MKKSQNQFFYLVAFLFYLTQVNISSLFAQGKNFIYNPYSNEFTGPLKEYWERFLIESSNNLPAIGEEVHITLKFKPSKDFEHLLPMGLELPEHCEFITGDTLYRGEMQKEQWFELKTTVRFMEKERTSIRIFAGGRSFIWIFYTGGAFWESGDVYDLRELIRITKKYIKDIKVESPYRRGLFKLRKDPHELVNELQYIEVPCNYDRSVFEETKRRNKELYKKLTKEFDSLEFILKDNIREKPMENIKRYDDYKKNIDSLQLENLNKHEIKRRSL